MSLEWPEMGAIHTLVFDFDGVFTDNGVYLDEHGKESIRCSRYDGMAFNLMRQYIAQGKLQADVFILSKEPNPVVLARAAKLKLDCIHGVDNKLAYLDNYFYEKHPDVENPYDGLVYLGNDLNDLAVMRKAGFSVSPDDAHAAIKKIASVVLPQQGGHGFVREFMERFLRLDTLSLDELEALV